MAYTQWESLRQDTYSNVIAILEIYFELMLTQSIVYNTWIFFKQIAYIIKFNMFINYKLKWPAVFTE